MTRRTLWTTLMILCIGTVGAMAQTPSSPPPSVSENSLGGFLQQNAQANELVKVALPLWAMIFGLASLYFLYKLSDKKIIVPNDVPRFFVLTLIIVSALIFICGKFENSEITPAIGLFGTIAGYVLGRSDRKEGANVPVKE